MSLVSIAATRNFSSLLTRVNNRSHLFSTLIFLFPLPNSGVPFLPRFDADMAELDASLSNLFADLKRSENNGEYEKALKTANKILDASSENQKAVHCKVVCFIQLNKFEEALDYLNNVDEDIRNQLNFEKSYCQYRLNKVQESLESLKLADQDDFGVTELEIQALYRIEDYGKCYSKYLDLIKNSGDDYEDERYVNLTAVMAGLSAEDVDFKSDLLDQNESTYEIIYNKACVLISNGQFESAIKKLNEAEVSCRKFLEDDGASEEEIESELAIIKAQIAFCQQKLGKNDIALKMYNDIFRQKLDDPALISVISNNVVAIHKDQNVFDSKKKIKSSMNESSEFKLCTSQKRSIYFNYGLFLININQFETCRKHLEVFKQKFPSFLNDATLIESYLHLKEKNGNQAIKVLNDYCQSKKSLTASDLDLALLLSQLYIKEENYKDAIRILEKLDHLKFLPAIFSTLYLLYEKIDNLKAVEDLFQNSIKWHENQKDSLSILLNFYREGAKFYLNHGKPQMAVKFLEKIIERKGKNAKITSMLINAYSQFDMSKAQSLQNELPSIEEILSSVDIEHLENKNWSLGVKYVKKLKDTPKIATSDKKNKKKKNRKKILPKNYNPNEKPDPERWLPKYERSNYRKKKDKKGVGKGTQGAIGEAPEIKPSPVVPSPQGPRQQRPTQKKKKKGGRK